MSDYYKTLGDLLEKVKDIDKNTRIIAEWEGVFVNINDAFVKDGVLVLNVDDVCNCDFYRENGSIRKK